MAPTFYVLEWIDAAGKKSTYRQRIQDIAPTSPQETAAGQLNDALQAVALGNINRAFFEIPATLTEGPVNPNSDVELVWKMAGIPTGGSRPAHIGIPSRNPDPALLGGNSGVLADLSGTAFAALLTIWNGGSIMDLRDLATGEHVAIDRGFATSRARVRPRVGARG